MIAIVQGNRNEENVRRAKPDAGDVVRAKLKALSEAEGRQTKADVLMPFKAEIQKCLDRKIAVRKIYDALVNPETGIEMSFSSFDRFVRVHCRKRTGKAAHRAPSPPAVPGAPEEKLSARLRAQREQSGEAGPNVAADAL